MTAEDVLRECAEVASLPTGIECMIWSYMEDERALDVRIEGAVLPQALGVRVAFEVSCPLAEMDLRICEIIGRQVKDQIERLVARGGVI